MEINKFYIKKNTSKNCKLSELEAEFVAVYIENEIHPLTSVNFIPIFNKTVDV